jgi:dephospho-CoA kinase
LLVIGLTGGIASGKTTVARLIKDRGFTVLDADQFARDVVIPGSAGWQEIRESFGEHYFNPDGTLDRALLAQTIFSDEATRERLNQIVHPKVISLIEQGIRMAEDRGESLVVVDVPLLFETELDEQMDAVIVVYVEPSIQVSRLQKRDKLTLEEAQNRIDAQLPLSFKVQRADYVVDNSGSMEETCIQVGAILDKLLGSIAMTRECNVDCESSLAEIDSDGRGGTGRGEWH